MSDEPKSIEQSVIQDEAIEVPVTRIEKEHSRAAKEFADVKTDKKMSMQVRVYSPFEDYFNGSAFSLSAENATGPFDILPKHHNFISLLTACEVVIRTVEGEVRKILISGGLIHVKADQTVIFLNI